MGIIRKMASSDNEFADHPAMHADISMQGYMFTRRKPTQPFKRVWCVLRGDTLFLYLGQNEKAPRSCYAVNGATIETQGLQDDGRYRFELVTMEKVDGGPGLHLNFAADLTRVATPFETLTEGDLTGWLHALAASHKDRGSMDGFRVAAVNGVVHELRDMLTAGTDVNTRFTEGRTALYWAACNDRNDAVRLLLKHKANPSLADSDGEAPLHIAAALGCSQVAESLLEFGASISQRMRDGRTPLHRASDNGRMQASHMETVRLLLAGGADAAAQSGEPSQSLHLAAFHGNVELIRTLLGHGVAAGCRDRDGYTPLHLAAFAGHAKAVRMLLERDANVLATDKDGATPLHLAAAQGNTEAVRSLVQMFAAPLDPCDQYGETPLHWAADRGHAQVVKLLVTLGAQPDSAATAGMVGWTAMHWAAARGNAPLVQTLLQLGAKAHLADAEGRTPQQHAEERAFTAVADLIAKHPPDGSPRAAAPAVAPGDSPPAAAAVAPVPPPPARGGSSKGSNVQIEFGGRMSGVAMPPGSPMTTVAGSTSRMSQGAMSPARPSFSALRRQASGTPSKTGSSVTCASPRSLAINAAESPGTPTYSRSSSRRNSPASHHSTCRGSVEAMNGQL